MEFIMKESYIINILLFTWALIFLRKIMKKVMKVAQICFEIDVNFIDFGAFFVNLSLRKVEIVY